MSAQLDKLASEILGLLPSHGGWRVTKATGPQEGFVVVHSPAPGGLDRGGRQRHYRARAKQADAVYGALRDNLVGVMIVREGSAFNIHPAATGSGWPMRRGFA